MIHIVCGIDDKFLMPCGVLMTSVFENNKNEQIEFHIITESLTKSSIDSLQNIADNYKQRLSIVFVEKTLFDDYPTNTYISTAAYNRILAAKILPSGMKRCLYLDADMIVIGNIRELYNANMNNAAVGVIIDQSGDDIRHFNRLDYNWEKGYFNSGLLLMDLDVWREKELSNKVLNYIDSHKSKLQFHDQDALNAVLYDYTYYFPMKYNMQFSFLYKNPFIAKSRWKDMCEAAEQPVIIHYTNKIKPWHRECIHPYKGIWFEYYKNTEWGKNKLKVYSQKGYMMILIKEFLNKCGIRKLNPPAMLREEFYKYYQY